MRDLDLLLEPIGDQQWQDRAACATADPAAFAAADGGLDDTAALAVCWTRCQVRGECGAYADEHDERFGIWGGARRG